MKKKYDLIIVGAGPAGLAAGIAAKEKNNIDILILEKQDEIGKRIRGETFKYDKELESKILYPGFFTEITINKTNKYRFYSPTTKNVVAIEAPQERHIIDWHKLMEGLVKKGKDSGIDIKPKHEVTDLLFKNGIYEGVTIFDGSKTFQLQSDLLILADGCENPLINKYGIQTPKENCPILKIIAENVKLDGNVIELFFSSGEDIPPGILSIFPRSETAAEANYVIFVGSLKESLQKDIKYWWDKISVETPVFSNRFKNSEVQYFDTSFLPFGGPLKDNIIPKARILLVGDNAGNNEPTGGSGLMTTMSMGYEIGQIASEIVQSSNIDESFLNESRKQLIKRIRKTATYRTLKDLARIAVDIRKAFFQVLVTPEKIDNSWDTLIGPTLQNAAEFF
ncbi:MAG: FAD-binding protein [Candidatus Helarchaeota archaeon]|nr:FAD-binding protein [Candidatus Helarchaeota archaeon]